MALFRPTLVFLLSWSLLGLATAQIFENTNIIRSVELGGSTVSVTRTFAVKALQDGASTYTVALSQTEQKRTSWTEARLKGGVDVLPIKPAAVTGFNQETFQYEISIPPMKASDTATLVFETTETHASYPWPATAGQQEAQDLKYDGELFVISPYHTASQETRFKGSSKFLNYTIPSGLSEFTSERPANQISGTVKYGPFKDVPPSANSQFIGKTQQSISLRYEYDKPLLTVTSLHRSAEISHWGSNLNIQDDIQLTNSGPTLKGQFSRIEYQMAKYQNRIPPHLVEHFSLHLPAGIHAPYYYDLNGNVSTSRYRPSNPKKRTGTFSLLELRPRYPLLGGWNYTFTLGWDAPLRDSAKYDSKSGVYTVAVPFWTPIPNAVVDKAEVSIILPEGATDVEIVPPDYFPMTLQREVHVTYLDTVGRPKIVLKKNGVTDKHTGLIYVSYKLPIMSHLRKPLAISLATFAVFVFGGVARRVDPRIHK